MDETCWPGVTYWCFPFLMEASSVDRLGAKRLAEGDSTVARSRLGCIIVYPYPWRWPRAIRNDSSSWGSQPVLGIHHWLAPKKSHVQHWVQPSEWPCPSMPIQPMISEWWGRCRIVPRVAVLCPVWLWPPLKYCKKCCQIHRKKPLPNCWLWIPIGVYRLHSRIHAMVYSWSYSKFSKCCIVYSNIFFYYLYHKQLVV